MKRLLRALLWFVFVYLAYGIFVGRMDIKIVPNELVADHPRGFHDYKGVINVHTARSTGSGSVEQVIAAAQQADLDFLILTDLNSYEFSGQEVEGYKDQLLVFSGAKYSYLNSRLMVFDSKTTRSMKSSGQSQVALTDLLSQPYASHANETVVMAHPFKPGFQWAGHYPEGLGGIEVINLKSMWQSAWLHSKASFFWSLLIWPFNENLSLLRLFENPVRELELWDSLNARHLVVGIAGSDAESRLNLTSTSSIAFPSYRTLFGLVSNHVLLNSELTGQALSDRQKILSALHNGQFYMSLDTLGNPKGFSTVVKRSNGTVLPMGSTFKFEEGDELHVDLPQKPLVPFDVMIYRDGERLLTSNSRQTRMDLHAPGIYRVIVRVIPTLPLPDGKKWIPWIYTNPFLVR